MQLSIIVPAHNEEKRLAKMLDEYLPFFARACGNDFEMLLVINGTTSSPASMAVMPTPTVVAPLDRIRPIFVVVSYSVPVILS